MPLLCPSCGYNNPDTHLYCEACGQQLPRSATPPAPPTVAAPDFAPPPTFSAPPPVPPPPPPGYGPPEASPVSGYTVAPGGYDDSYTGGPWRGPMPQPANISWIGDSWNLVMQNMGEMVGYFFVLLLIQLAATTILTAPAWLMVVFGDSDAQMAGNMLSNVLQFLVQIFQGILAVGVASSLLRRFRFGDPLNVGQTLSDGFGLAVPAAIYTVVTSIIVGIGTCFCLLPGIWLSAAMQLGYFRLADGAPDFWTAFTDGLEVAKADVGGYFFLVILSALVAGLGILACGIGILWTMPVYYLVWAFAYRASFDRG